MFLTKSEFIFTELLHSDLKMRLFSDRFVLAGESFRLCGTSLLGVRTVASIDVLEDVRGSEDKIGVVMVVKKRTEVYCTPRCHFTMSWEVGLCHDYLVTYLVGSTRMTSFDYHILQSFEVIHVFLHAVEIQEQSGPYFELYGSFCRFRVSWLKKKISQLVKKIKLDDILVRHMFHLMVAFLSYLYSDVSTTSATTLISQLADLRQQYLDNHHLDQLEGTVRSEFTRVLGLFHGFVVGRMRQMNLVLRRYFRSGPKKELVSYI